MSKTNRRKFTAEFKVKVCVDALKEQLIQTLYAQIGELKVANDFLKKKLQ